MNLTGDYYSEVMPYVDYFVLKTNYLAGGHWNSWPDLNFNLTSMVTVDALTKIRLTAAFLFRKIQ
jgi:hypothetical protein